MRVNIAFAQATAPYIFPHNNASSSLRLQHFQPSIFKLSLPKSTAQISCSANFDGHDFPIKQNIHMEKNMQQLSPPTTTSSWHLHSQVDLLGPSYFGIRPEPQDWPTRDEFLAHQETNIDLPFSLHMMKMKQRHEEERKKNVKFDQNKYDPVNNLCYSTLYIIKEVQTHALKIREVVLDEDLYGVQTKIHKEMTSCFVWLLKEVFSKTPDLMLQSMVLASNFTTFSLEPTLEFEEKLGKNSRDFEFPKGMVEEGNEMKGGNEKKNGLELSFSESIMEQKLVSPERGITEKEDNEEHYRTDLMYQMGLSQDPSNTLLLSNYAQFLCLVSHDYDRAEECFKRAIQLDVKDAEVISQYANFLWVVRKDVCKADEQFQEAVVVEPNNPYYASKYASFLWNSADDDSCNVLDPPPYGKG